jgi:prepilin-type N-terminal cleavage/methylation domain-containing protein
MLFECHAQTLEVIMKIPRRGFTLIELMVVVFIISVLAALLLPGILITAVGMALFVVAMLLIPKLQRGAEPAV